MRADLHMHSVFSDGSMTPGECVLAASRAGLDLIAITDHDTTAHVASSLEAGERYGVRVIPGIEISAFDFVRKRKVHILGYGFGPSARAIERICSPIRKARHESIINAIDVMRGIGFDVTAEEVIEIRRAPSVLYKQHVLDVLTMKGQADGIYGKTYERLFKNGGPCSEQIRYVDAREAIGAVKKDGGLAFLAHPGQTDSLEIMVELMREGLDGVELVHDANEEGCRAVVKEFCERRGLLMSGGSDCHGKFGNERAIGSSVCPDGFGGEILQRITKS